MLDMGLNTIIRLVENRSPISRAATNRSSDHLLD
jgi:hypothetical protein